MEPLRELLTTGESVFGLLPHFLQRVGLVRVPDRGRGKATNVRAGLRKVIAERHALIEPLAKLAKAREILLAEKPFTGCSWNCAVSNTGRKPNGGLHRSKV